MRSISAAVCPDHDVTAIGEIAGARLPAWRKRQSEKPGRFIVKQQAKAGNNPHLGFRTVFDQDF